MSTARSFSRRALLTGAAALGVVAGGLGIGAILSTRQDVLRSILERLVGPFDMANADFDRFVADLEGTPSQPTESEADFIRLLEELNLVEAVVGRNSPISEKLEAFERGLLTEFVLATGLSDRRPPSERLTYNGLFKRQVCSNPFAVLSE